MSQNRLWSRNKGSMKGHPVDLAGGGVNSTVDGNGDDENDSNDLNKKNSQKLNFNIGKDYLKNRKFKFDSDPTYGLHDDSVEF